MTDLTGIRDKIEYPAISEVRLLKGSPFYDMQQNMNEFLLAQDTDSLLYNFRKASGLPTGDAAPMTGWDADECKLKGHTTGHYLSGVSLAYAATGDERFLTKASAIVEGLRECQEAFSRSGHTAPGFLSAYDESQFDLLEKFTKYPEIWAPYYTLDKIMSGLYDCYVLTGNTTALEVLSQMGDWVYARLSRLTDETRAEMWSMYIAGEYGAMIGTMVKLYRLTGKDEHFAAARLFENDKLFGPLKDNVDCLEEMHANQHIPQIMGALEIYRALSEGHSGDQGRYGVSDYYEIADNFWNIVTGHHAYTIGGVGEQEKFHKADTTVRRLTDSTAESCASYNMLRLTGMLFKYRSATGPDTSEPDTTLMDYYENTLFNHILVSFSHKADGGTTYFLPLRPGGHKVYSTDENSCCHGTGMESRYRYMENIFAYDDDLLYICLPVSASLKGAEALTVTCCESSDSFTMRISIDSDMKRGLAVRVPRWAGKDSGWLKISQGLKAGNTIDLEFPVSTRRVSSVYERGYYSIARGPYLMAAVSDEQDFLTGSEVLKPGSSRGSSLKPAYMIDQENYHIYFKE